MRVNELLREAVEKLERAGVENARFDALELLKWDFGWDTTRYLYFQREEMEKVFPIDAKREERFRLFQTHISQRAERIPLQQILGECEFYGLRFLVNENVLCPRQDTELLVEKLIEDYKNVDKSSLRLLDMCTGSGCIALSLAKIGAFPNVTAVDISESALEVAKRNAREILGEEWKRRIQFLQSDLFSVFIEDAEVTEAEIEQQKKTAEQENTTEIRKIRKELASGNAGEMKKEGWEIPKAGTENTKPERFDIIVSNPPYIRSSVIAELEPEVREHEPRLALDGTEDGLFFYRKLCEEAPRYLNPMGRLYVEIGYDQGAEVKTLFEKEGFRGVSVLQDYGGNDRMVLGMWNGR